MRISKVTTKMGDKGQTKLGDGSEVSKSHIRIECLGQIDELNSMIGFACSVCKNKNFIKKFKDIQNDLLNLGGEVSLPKTKGNLLSDQRILEIENFINQLNSELPPLKEFIIPGGDDFSSRIHIARTTCRKVERKIVSLLETEEGNENWIRYFNRLSDFLFVLVRFYTQKNDIDEIQWNRSK